ncbi:hypothetical protein [Eubacterium pyruvativorans]|nr:hypothetical protein [Eubacterium pyruvativorans]
MRNSKKIEFRTRQADRRAFLDRTRQADRCTFLDRTRQADRTS